MNVNIPLGRYTLRSDSNSWSIVEPKIVAEGKRAGTAYETMWGSYGRLSQALPALADLELRHSGATSLQELSRALQAFRERVETAFAAHADL